MTELEQYLSKKPASKARISKITGVSKSRISELTLNPSIHLRAWELYLIALALDVDTRDVQRIFKDIKLENKVK